MFKKVMNTPIAIFWFRRDLRLHDNAGLYHALKGTHPVLPLFIFDTDILDDLLNREDARVQFIHDQITHLHTQLGSLGSSLIIKIGRPVQVWEELLQTYPIATVYTNRDYEPYALERDQAVAELFQKKGIQFHTFKDHVIFEKDEILKDNGTPYTVFTPYSKKWLAKLNSQQVQVGDTLMSSFFAPYPTEAYFKGFSQHPPYPIPSLHDLGFKPSSIPFPPSTIPQSIVKNYDKTRNIPSINGTSRLGIHFRFGTISIREKARAAQQLNGTFLNELIWRDFYSQILAHFPKVVHSPFQSKYDAIPWRNDKKEFESWKAGKTGYAIVDAGMRELAATGFMHNRVRMIAASFLTKHLLIDWRWGEAWFAEKLLDFDLASNSGGWQWAAGCGTDAAPYFRIFNPLEQTKKFDPEYKYIKKWVPEFGSSNYLSPIVDHAFARARCLETYKNALDNTSTI
jgi:deoxyribodipyrimidine photo-lyase